MQDIQQVINSLFDQYPIIPISLMALLVILALRRWLQKRREAQAEAEVPEPSAPLRQPARVPIRKRPAGALDVPLFDWTPHDPFTVRDLLNGGVLILGRAGSGKTSSSGRTLMQAIVKNPRSGGLILAAKPEDAGDVQRIFQKAGRMGDLVVFDAHNHWRFNFLEYVGRGEARNVVQCMMMLGETLSRGERGSGEDGDYWKAQCERLLETAVVALQAADEPVTPVNLHNFVTTAANSTAELTTPAWQAKYQSQVLERGFNAHKPPRLAHDYQMAKDYWIMEYPGMADRTRSSILTYATQILHVFNTGLCKEMVAEETNITPDAILDGAWVLVNFPPSSYGAVGAFISTGWKYLTQLAILKRKATDASPFVTIWNDEAHQTVTSYDATFIAQCRSHKGCLVYLTQSVSSFYAAMKGRTGEHQANALLANFSQVIVHSCDPATAQWASAKLGKRKEMLYSGNSSPMHGASIWEQMHGPQNVSAGFSEQYQDVLQTHEFMAGRTGGPQNRFVADAVVIKSGEPFSSGKSYVKISFSQRG